MAPTRYENGSPETSADRVPDEASLPDFPLFDSLPATAGLSNTEAFRLSLEHALALLPRMLDARQDGPTDERFSLR